MDLNKIVFRAVDGGPNSSCAGCLFREFGESTCAAVAGIADSRGLPDCCDMLPGGSGMFIYVADCTAEGAAMATTSRLEACQ